MNPEAVRLMTDVERYRNLRRSVVDEQTREAVEHLINEIEERLQQLENAGDCYAGRLRANRDHGFSSGAVGRRRAPDSRGIKHRSFSKRASYDTPGR
jgi:hypothetical protein